MTGKAHSLSPQPPARYADHVPPAKTAPVPAVEDDAFPVTSAGGPVTDPRRPLGIREEKAAWARKDQAIVTSTADRGLGRAAGWRSSTHSAAAYQPACVEAATGRMNAEGRFIIDRPAASPAPRRTPVGAPPPPVAAAWDATSSGRRRPPVPGSPRPSSADAGPQPSHGGAGNPSWWGLDSRPPADAQRSQHGRRYYDLAPSLAAHLYRLPPPAAGSSLHQAFAGRASSAMIASHDRVYDRQLSQVQEGLPETSGVFVFPTLSDSRINELLTPQLRVKYPEIDSYLRRSNKAYTYDVGAPSTSRTSTPHTVGDTQILVYRDRDTRKTPSPP